MGLFDNTGDGASYAGDTDIPDMLRGSRLKSAAGVLRGMIGITVGATLCVPMAALVVGMSLGVGAFAAAPGLFGWGIGYIVGGMAGTVFGHTLGVCGALAAVVPVGMMGYHICSDILAGTKLSAVAHRGVNICRASASLVLDGAKGVLGLLPPARDIGGVAAVAPVAMPAIIPQDHAPGGSLPSPHALSNAFLLTADHDAGAKDQVGLARKKTAPSSARRPEQ